MAVNLEVKVDPSDAEENLKKIGDAGEQAGGKVEKSFKEGGDAADAAMAEIAEGAKGAAGGVREVTLNVDQAGESLAAAAVNATDLRRRLSDAAKEMSEGISRATEIALRTGDAGEAAIALAEGASKAVTAFNPMVGAIAMAATHAARMTKELWQSSVAAKAAADAMDIGGIVKDRFQLDEDVLMGYDALKSKIEAIKTSMKTYENAIEDLKKKQIELSEAGLSGTPAHDEARRREQELYEARERLQHDLDVSQKAIDIAKANRDAEGRKRWEDYNKEAQAIFDSEKKHLEFQKMSIQQVVDLQNELAIKLREANGDEEKSREILTEIETLQRRRVELTKQQADEQKKADEEWRKSQEERDKRNSDIQKELDRIHNLDIKAAEEETETRADLERIVRDTATALGDQTLEAEKQNELLREMERAKRKMMDLDRKAADDRKRADQDAAQRQAEAREEEANAKRRWLDTEEGKKVAQQAESPEAIRDRIARETGRKRGTVEGMMRRGEIDATQWAGAAKANTDEAWQNKRMREAGMPVAANEAVKVQGRHMADTRESLKSQDKQSTELANMSRELDEFSQWRNSIEGRDKATIEAGRRRRAAQNTA